MSKEAPRPKRTDFHMELEIRNKGSLDGVFPPLNTPTLASRAPP